MRAPPDEIFRSKTRRPFKQARHHLPDLEVIPQEERIGTRDPLSGLQGGLQEAEMKEFEALLVESGTSISYVRPGACEDA